MRLTIQQQAFDPGSEVSEFSARAAGAGAIVTFTGLVRGEAGAVAGMMIEHYPGMTEKAISAMMQDACKRWDLTDVRVIHRFGQMAVGEAIMLVATASRHRRDAFEAADFLMDYLKSRAPFWKKETGPEGSDWVAQQAADEAALKRW